MKNVIKVLCIAIAFFASTECMAQVNISHPVLPKKNSAKTIAATKKACETKASNSKSSKVNAQAAKRQASIGSSASLSAKFIANRE